MTDTTTPPAPLNGVRVVELSDGVAGAYAGRLLALSGADVIKVEPPDGDVVQRWGGPARTRVKSSTMTPSSGNVIALRPHSRLSDAAGSALPKV